MKKYYHYELNMWVMNILSIVLFLVPYLILYLCGYNVNFNFDGYILFGMLIYLITHELFHALGYSIFARDKKNIKIGITLEHGVFYAACQEALSKKAIIVSLLFPLIFLTLIPLPFALYFHIDFLTLYAITNLGGAIGDILMFFLILKMPKDMEYIDYDNSVGAYILSKNDLSNIKSLGFKLGKSGKASDELIDKSVKHFYVSKPSIIILLVFIVLSILNIIL